MYHKVFILALTHCPNLNAKNDGVNNFEPVAHMLK